MLWRLIAGQTVEMSQVSKHDQSVTVRPAVHADIPALLGLWTIAAENDGRPADTALAVETLLVRDPNACLLALVGHDIVGSIIAGWDGWRAHLYRLAVHPDYRRRGVGGHLLDVAAQRLTSLGARRLDAMVLAGNDLGEAAWIGAGYACQDDWRRWVKPLRT